VSTTDATAPAPYGSVNIIDAFAESMAEAYPEYGAPPHGWSGTSEDDAAAADATGLPDDTEAHADEGETVAPPDDETKADAAPAKAKAPAKLTLTEDELRERLDEATKRERASQQAEAKKAADLARENKRLLKALEARELGLNQLQSTYQGTEAEMAILRERRRMDAFTEGELARAEEAEQQTAQEAREFEGRKQAVANDHYKDALLILRPEARALGYSDADVDAIVLDLFAHDETVRDFNEEFASARSLADADKAAKRAYRELAKSGKAALQAKKIADLTPETPPKEPTKRAQAHGSFRSGHADPLDTLPMKQRGTTRLSEAMAEDFARLGIG
jgi:hypothetical protein